MADIIFRNRPQTVERRPSRPLRQLKPQVDQLVVKWVTISESWLLIVFAFFLLFKVSNGSSNIVEMGG
jgi:hypothetical protein